MFDGGSSHAGDVTACDYPSGGPTSPDGHDSGDVMAGRSRTSESAPARSGCSRSASTTIPSLAQVSYHARSGQAAAAKGGGAK